MFIREDISAHSLCFLLFLNSICREVGWGPIQIPQVGTFTTEIKKPDHPIMSGFKGFELGRNLGCHRAL